MTLQTLKTCECLYFKPSCNEGCSWNFGVGRDMGDAIAKNREKKKQKEEGVIGIQLHTKLHGLEKYTAWRSKGDGDWHIRTVVVAPSAFTSSFSFSSSSLSFFHSLLSFPLSLSLLVGNEMKSSETSILHYLLFWSHATFFSPIANL